MTRPEMKLPVGVDRAWKQTKLFSGAVLAQKQSPSYSGVKPYRWVTVSAVIPMGPVFLGPMQLEYDIAFPYYFNVDQPDGLSRTL